MSRTISIITFYNPTNENVNNMLRIAEQSDIVIICDNSEESNIDLLRNVFDIFDHDKIIYHSFHKNLGLSAAFNKVLRDGELIGRLEWQYDDFVLFFDQDSLIEKNHIKLLEEEFLLLEKTEKKKLAA